MSSLLRHVVITAALGVLVASTTASRIITLSPDGAWCWFQDPRAVYIKGSRERVYAQWITSRGQLQVSAHDLITGETQVHTLEQDWGSDDHNVGSFLVLPDNRLMIFYAQHNGKGIYCRTAVRAEDISAWGDRITIDDSGGITYSHPVYLADENKFYVFWRGSTRQPTFATSMDGATWSEPQVIIDNRRIRDRKVRPYLKVCSDGHDSIHFAFTDSHPRLEEENSIYYLHYHHGEFLWADGSVAGNINTLPIRLNSADVVYDSKKEHATAWVWDIAVGHDARPVIAYARFPSPEEHRYVYARWTGSEWASEELCEAGKWFPKTPTNGRQREVHYSGGLAFKHSDPRTIYLSREVDGQFRIERWFRTNEADWKRRVLAEEASEDYIRPIGPRSYSGSDDVLLWMAGSYLHYTNFQTRIMMMKSETTE